jgi:hypothetical protein
MAIWNIFRGTGCTRTDLAGSWIWMADPAVADDVPGYEHSKLINSLKIYAGIYMGNLGAPSPLEAMIRRQFQEKNSNMTNSIMRIQRQKRGFSIILRNDENFPDRARLPWI